MIKGFKFDITREHVIIIAEILQTGPYKTVKPILDELQRQITEQELLDKNESEDVNK